MRARSRAADEIKPRRGNVGRRRQLGRGRLTRRLHMPDPPCPQQAIATAHPRAPRSARDPPPPHKPPPATPAPPGRSWRPDRPPPGLILQEFQRPAPPTGRASRWSAVLVWTDPSPILRIHRLGAGLAQPSLG